MAKLQFDGKVINHSKQLLDLERVEMEDSLYLFLRSAWKYIDAAPWKDGWPIQAIAEHLQAVVDGDIKRLLINIPPRMGKSSICSVALPAWIWAQPWDGPTSGPGVQLLHASYGDKLALRDSRKCRMLIESPWYQKYWGDRYKIIGDQNTKGRYATDKNGERLITSVGANVTGEGGNIIIVDDPNAAGEEFSEANIEATKDWWDGTMSTRLNDMKTGAFIVIQQRLAEDDLTGHILEKEADEWVHLCLPMKYEPERSYVMPVTGWKDPRTVPGELLWPDRFGDAEVARLERILGKFKAAGQLQQRPEPPGGGVIKRDWWKLWERDVFPPFDFILASLDTAYTTKTENDYSAMTVWGVFSGDAKAVSIRDIDSFGRPMFSDRIYTEEAPKVMLMFAWQKQLELHELVQEVAKTCKKLKVDKLIIENKAAGHSVSQELRRLYQNEKFAVQLYDPKSQDKLSRLYSVQHLFSEGMVYAPDKAWAEMTITQIAQFPKGKHDDLCFVAGTEIITRNGIVSIERVTIEDEVLTPLGWKRVLASGPTGVHPVVEAQGLTGTPNHPVFCLDGWRSLDTVTHENRIMGLNLCDLIQTIRRKPWNSTVSHTAGWAEAADIICPKAPPVPDEKMQKGCMLLFGSISPVELFRLTTKLIISTAILLTAALKIWSVYQGAFIKRSLKSCLRGMTSTLRKRAPLPAFGISPKLAVSGIDRPLLNFLTGPEPQGFTKSPLRAAFAFGAGVNLHSRRQLSDFAPHDAKSPNLNTGEAREATHHTTICLVYNLTVADAHCYYANGKLAHNCDTVSQSLRHLRDIGLLTRSEERVQEIESMKTYPGGQPTALYPV